MPPEFARLDDIEVNQARHAIAQRRNQRSITIIQFEQVSRALCAQKLSDSTVVAIDAGRADGRFQPDEAFICAVALQSKRIKPASERTATVNRAACVR